MLIRYTGPDRGQQIRLPDGEEVLARRGSPVEVPDAVGRDLLRRTYWNEVVEEPEPEPEPKPSRKNREG